MSGKVLAILVGGFVAGLMDLVAAFILYGRNVPLRIASGLIGAQAFQGGVAVWILGLFLHFIVAFSAAAVYCLASLKLGFLKENFIICGMFFGIAVFLVMNLIVVPLSAVSHKSGTFTTAALIRGLLIHMLIIGLPISASVRKFSK